MPPGGEATSILHRGAQHCSSHRQEPRRWELLGEEQGAVALVQLERQDPRSGTKRLQEGRGALR